MPFIFSSDIPQTWDVVHTESRHKYTMYERLTRQEALGIQDRRKELSKLFYDIEHSTNSKEKEILLEQFRAINQELLTTMGLVLRRCLKLTDEQVDDMEVEEARSIFLKMVEFCS